jgi:hypothetical protein
MTPDTSGEKPRRVWKFRDERSPIRWVRIIGGYDYVRDWTKKVMLQRESQLGPMSQGDFDSVRLLLRDVAHVREAYGVGDTDFWQPIEETATMTPDSACFQYYLRKTDHIKLAGMILDSFGQIRISHGMGGILPEVYQQIKDALSSEVLKHYPPKYRRKWEKNHPTK